MGAEERGREAGRALVEAAQGGDRQALDELLAGYLPLVYNIVGRALDGHQDVDDVVQETLIRMVDRLGDLRDPSAFRSWLVAIAVRQVRERWRTRQARPIAYGAAFEGPVDTADPGADFVDLTILRLELSDQRRETVLATRWLDPEDRELLALWWLEAAGELNRCDLVDALGLPAGHVSVRVQRLKQQLDVARAVVRALAAVPRCPALDEIASGWDGSPDSVWRKRFARHTRECVACARAWQGLIPAEGLLAGLPLVPVAAPLAAQWLRGRVPGTTAHGAAPTGAHAAGAGRAVPRGARVARGARRGAKAGRLAGSASVRTVAAGAALAVAAGVGIAYAAFGATTPRTVPSAASYRPGAPAPGHSAKPSHSAAPSPRPSSSARAHGLTITKVALPARFSYLTAGYNGLPQWTRVDTEAAPDGTLRVAWPAADGVHVTSLSRTLLRSGPDTVVPGAREVGGLVAHNDGFALLTRVPDSNKWGDTAAALVRYRGGALAFRTRLTGAASNDTAPVLDGQLKWNGSRYGAYFVVHGAGGFADGHYGDKLAYVGASGARLGGGWDWGCSHNEGIALHAEASGPFTSLCLDDWRSGLFVSTGIGAPDEAPVVQREQCWAGYCGGSYPQNAGGLVKSPSGAYATAWASRGAASAVKNPADASGRGWSVTPRTATHEVALAFLRNGSTPAGRPVLLTNDPGTDHVNVRIAPYGRNLLVSWESVTGASCANGTCTGHFAGTHLRVVDWSGRTVGPDTVVNAHIAGDIAVLPDGSLAWAFVQATPNDAAPMSSPGPTASTLSLAHLSE